MSIVIENIRLGELALVAEQNKPTFDDFVSYLSDRGYNQLFDFVSETDQSKAESIILDYLKRPFPAGLVLYDGIARPYRPEKAKWLLLGWIFRDAPIQRLQPIISTIDRPTNIQRQASLLNKVRAYVAQIFPDPERWTWKVIAEVVIDRLEGSRRAIKGTLFEAIVRRILIDIFERRRVKLTVSDAEIKLGGETYDVSVVGPKGRVLLPVKTRETMGGGHALLFTRDIHKSVSAAHASKLECLPIIIAESWSGDLGSLECKDYIAIKINPNQIKVLEPILAQELEKRLPLFVALCN